MNRGIATSLFFAAALLCRAQDLSSVSFSIEADRLNDADGNPMPDSGQVLLIASTGDSIFSSPIPGSFASSFDDIVLARWTIGPGFGPGVFINLLSTSLSGNWKAGDPVALVWYPTLTAGDTGPALGMHYGFFREDVADPATQGRDSWVTPTPVEGGALADLKFATTQATFINLGDYVGGPYAKEFGDAVNTVPVPEPSVYGGVFGVLCLGFAFFKKRFKRA